MSYELSGNQFLDFVQLSAHRQIFDQLCAVLTFFGGRMEEQFSESGPIDGVDGKVGGHRQVHHGRGKFGLNLSLHCTDTFIVHFVPAGWRQIGSIVFAWKQKKILKNGSNKMPPLLLKLIAPFVALLFYIYK